MGLFVSNKKTTQRVIVIDFPFSHAIIDIEKGRAANTSHVEPLKRRWQLIVFT